MGEDTLVLRVECYAGYRGEQTPTRFFIGQRKVEVAEVLDRWIGPDHRYFKLRGDDSGIYLLRHDERSDRWELTVYDSGGREETRLSST
jgi:hypothetical protein